MDNIYGRTNRKSFESLQASRDTWSNPAGRLSYDTMVRAGELREKNDDYYTSKKNIEDEKGSKRVFFPISEEWQNEKANQFKIKVVKIFKYGVTKNFYDRTAPKKTIPVEGDGNCFFRAISMCIIGSENEHLRIREIITKHVEENPDMYRTFLQSRGGMNQYLTSMRRPREWATDVEILAAATLLKTIIEVYFPCRIKGHVEFRWQTFKPLTHPDITYPAIYLSNKNDHFDPVLDVCDEDDSPESRRSIPTSQSESPIRKSVTDHNPRVYSDPLPSNRSSHMSSFERIHGISGPNYSNISNSRSSSRATHPNVQF